MYSLAFAGLPQGSPDAPVLLAHPREGIPHVIDTEEDLASARAALERGSTPVAIDVERAHGYRYHNHPYLIQIRREGVGSFLIDPRALPDLSSLNVGVGDTWLLHDASQDLANLRFVGLKGSSLFDTMIASRLLGLRSFGLQASCQHFLGLTLAKDHQANDWSIRPLYMDWLRYAVLDVELLTALYVIQGQQLHDLGRWEWAEQEFQSILNAPAPLPHPEPWRKNTGAGRLRDRQQLAVFRSLWELREKLACEADVDPRRLIPKNDLVSAATRIPRNRRTLLTIPGFRLPLARQHADQWLRAIYVAVHSPRDSYPSVQGVSLPGEIPAASSWKVVNPEGFARLRRVRQEVAQVAGLLDLADEVVLQPRAQRVLTWASLPSRGSVVDAVERRLREGGARPWQIELMAAPLAKALR